MRKQVLVILFFFNLLQVKAQNIALGSWRTHFSYQQAQHVAIAGDKIYCASTIGLFYFDKQDNALQKIGKLNGLSEVEVSALAYDPVSEVLVIGYADGNIDLIKDQNIINLNDISQIQLRESKRYNDITFENQRAYLASDFGVVVLDLQRFEFRETFINIGVGGTGLQVFGTSIANDTLYLATDEGVMAGSLRNNTNLLDYNNWRRFSAEDGLPVGKINHIASLEGKVYAAINDDGLYQWNGRNWLKVDFDGPGVFHDLTATANFLLVSRENRLTRWRTSEDFEVITSPEIIAPKDAQVDNAGFLWIADQVHGLVSDYRGNFSTYLPNGPNNNRINKLVSYPGNTLGIPGAGDTPDTIKGGLFSFFTGGSWQNFSSGAPANLPTAFPLVDAAFDIQGKQVYFATDGSGLLQWNLSEDFTVIDANTENSPLRSVGLNQRTNISAVAVDDAGALWLVNPAGTNFLHRRQVDREWTTFDLGIGRTPVAILIADNGDKWLRLNPADGGGILVFNEENGQRNLSTLQGQGNLPGISVFDMAKDKNGQIWVATNSGLAYFPNPSAVFDAQPFDAIVPIYEGTFLFRGEKINALAIDGGNRIWIGTNTALWLFSEGGEQLIHQFTTSNSPIPAGEIQDISIDGANGEVFIATAKGLVSFRGSATESNLQHREVKIFPNPVVPGFNGLVGISGLATDATVKITDIGGRLVRQVRASGGTATWDVRDINGNRAATGIYLILSASEDGQETFVGKMAVIE